MMDYTYLLALKEKVPILMEGLELIEHFNPMNNEGFPIKPYVELVYTNYDGNKCTEIVNVDLYNPSNLSERELRELYKHAIVDAKKRIIENLCKGISI